jgi:coproporphyrinogen III oxidase-like Fe-S oxidoreductase
VQAAGFKDISADLIYGTPHLSDEDLMADAEVAFYMDPMGKYLSHDV